jgi:hypothetical protein
MKATKGTTQNGGIQYILTQDAKTTETKPIYDTVEMEAILLKRNQTHFAQAMNTPCAIDKNNTYFGYDGCNSITKNILKGHITIDVEPTMKLILNDMTQKRPTMPCTMTLDDMIVDFHKWRESTTTSPSGKNIGMYKTLTTYYYSNKLPTHKINNNGRTTIVQRRDDFISKLAAD